MSHVLSHLVIAALLAGSASTPAQIPEPSTKPPASNTQCEPILQDTPEIIKESTSSSKIRLEDTKRSIPNVTEKIPSSTESTTHANAPIDSQTIAKKQTSENQTSENQTSENQTSENQTSENQTSENQTSESQTSENQTSESQTSESQTSENQTSKKQTSTKQTPSNPPSSQGNSIKMPTNQPAVPTKNKKFDHDIASYITHYTGAETLNRNYNMRLASNSIHEVILQPGDTFSFNDTILAKSHGGNDYKTAGVFVNGRVSSGIGGGICQISSTLYQAALYSGMTIQQRRNHSRRVGYMPAGRDATVSWGSVDFKFQNNLKVPVMIESVMNNHTLKIRFLSQTDPNIGAIKVVVSPQNGSYFLKRIRQNGVIDYTATSRYRN